MNDAENFWNRYSGKLRRFKGLCPLTPEEAEQALKKIPHRDASDEEIDSIIEAISRDEVPESDNQPQVDWSPESDYAEIDSEAVLFRNEGEDSTETDALEDELIEELLDDDEPENDRDDMEG